MLQRGPRVALTAVRHQGSAVPPPDVLALENAGAGEAALAQQADAALRGAQGRGGVAGEQQHLRQRDQHVQLEAGVGGAHLAQEGAQALQCAAGIAFCQGQDTRPQLAVAACDRLVERAGQRVVGGPARTRASNVAEGDPPTEHDAHFQCDVQRGAGAFGLGHALFAQAAGSAPQPQLGKGEREVAHDQHLAIDVAGVLEGLRGLAQQAHALGDVGAAEAQHVQGIGQAVAIASAPRQLDRALRRRARGLVARQARLRERDQPPGAAVAHAVARRFAQAGGLLGGGQRGLVLRRAQQRLGCAQEAARKQGVAPARLGQRQSLLGRNQRPLVLAQAHQHPGLARQRLHLERGLRMRIGQGQHGGGVQRGVVEARLGDERFGAQVEQGHALRRTQARCGERLGGGGNGLRLHAGPDEGGDALGVLSVHGAIPAGWNMECVRLTLLTLCVNMPTWLSRASAARTRRRSSRGSGCGAG